MTNARTAAVAAALVAAATFVVGLRYGSTTAGGADSYGYVSQAVLWRQGRLTIDEPLARQSPWPLAIDTWAPLGYRAASDRADAIVPVYSPGLPLIMAAFQIAGGYCAAFVVVPLAGALAVWLTFTLGLRIFAAPSTALGGALLVATSPTFLYQLMNPMTDVPVTAAWALALLLVVADWPLAAGLAAGVALLIRPNLAAVAVVLGAWLLIVGRRPLRFAAGIAPAVAAIASINIVVYGSPSISGYGTLGDLYAWSNLTTNLRQFVTWIVETQTPVIALVPIYFVARRLTGDTAIPHGRALVGGAVAAVWLSYLFYLPFDAWWYLRFLLPAWPAMLLAVAAILGAVARCIARPRAAAAMALAATLALALNGARVAIDRFAFDIGRTERHYVDVARFVASHTDPRAVMISLQHSGSLRWYADRRTLRFDQLDAAWLDRVVAFLQASDRHPYIVLDGDEVALFRKRFGALNATGRLDWPPLAAMTTGADVSVFDPLARERTEAPLAIAATASRHAGWRCDPPATTVDVAQPF